MNRFTILRSQAESATEPYSNLIEEHADFYGVDPDLVRSVITVESRGDSSAQSGAGAMGLMQLMPAVCTDYGISEPFDPDANIRGGTALISRHLKRYNGNLTKVLAAYNAGPGNVATGKWLKFSETRKYVPKVLGFYKALKATVPPVVPETERVAMKPKSTPFKQKVAVVAEPSSKPAEPKSAETVVATTVSKWVGPTAIALFADYLSGKISIQML